MKQSSYRHRRQQALGSVHRAISEWIKRSHQAGLRSAVLGLVLAFSCVVNAQQDITQPGDPLIASSSNSPGSEGVANAIDGKQTKYLNFDSRTPEPIKPSGFIVSPSIGVTRVTGMTIQSANDAQERDPKTVTLEGSNDDAVTSFSEGNWDMIATVNVPDFTARFETQAFSFPNFKAYKHYRWTVTETRTANGCCMQVAEVELLGSLLPPDVTQPGDPLIASSSNSPGSEGVANAIDGKQTKYLNFDSRTPEPIKPSGFVVSPAIGRTVVTGMTIQSANDAQERDPKTVTLEGSNDDAVTAFNEGTWEMITTINAPDYTARFQTQTFLFDNIKPYKHYRWTVTETRTANGCCMQVAEVELLGTSAPKDITQPGDAIIASSSNSPGSEGVANAIDDKQTKYLNFDSRTPEPIKPSGFVVSPSIGATTVTGMTIQSANDAQERDPKTVTLEGSNDETIASFTEGTWQTITTINVPDFTARFQTQEFFFANSKSYKHYRWTVTETRTANGCCMQVAEVELLAVTLGADCNKAAFVLQPVDTPVLSGSSATFVTIVNGPWPLQWLRNGQPIAGASSTTYTTDPITAANAGDVYAVEIVGCEKSADVKAVIFTPSATKSIGISFVGGSANGAPTTVNTNDIMGIAGSEQAFWLNAAGGTGSLPDFNVDPPVMVVGSDNTESTITFDWETGGNWGAGTGDATSTQRLLNGLTGRNAPGTPSTYTFSNVPTGTHAVIAYAVSPPLQFQAVSFTVGTTTYYMRTMNSDEYNAAPGYFRGASTDKNNPTVGNYVRFDNVRAEGGIVTLSVETLTPGFDRQTGVNAVQLLLNAQAPGAPPTITADPQSAVAAAGATVAVSVTASGENLTYQWRKNGRNLPNGGGVNGATTSALTISGFSEEAHAGVYSVAVFNPAGSAISKNAAVRLSKFDISDALVGYWKFDETSGATAANAVTGGKPGTVNGTASWAAGQIGNALTFDGGSTYVFVADYTKAKGQIGGSAWVNVAAGTTTDVAIFQNAQPNLTVSGGQRRIVGQFEVGLVADPNDGLLRPMAGIGIGPNVARATGSSVFPLGTWHHIAFSADGAQLRLYVDGQQVSVADYLAEINPPDIPYIAMGARLNVDVNDPASPIAPDLDAPNFLAGQLDDVALWTRALTAEEVSKVFDAGKAKQAVTTVQITPPPQTTTPTLGVSSSGGNVTITWDSGKLQTAPSVTGPWADVTGASPLTEAISGAAKFYRAVAQ